MTEFMREAVRARVVLDRLYVREQEDRLHIKKCHDLVRGAEERHQITCNRRDVAAVRAHSAAEACDNTPEEIAAEVKWSHENQKLR